MRVLTNARGWRRWIPILLMVLVLSVNLSPQLAQSYVATQYPVQTKSQNLGVESRPSVANSRFAVFLPLAANEYVGETPPQNSNSSKGTRVYAWYKDSNVSVGTSKDLDQFASPRKYTLPGGVASDTIIAVDVAPSDNHVYVWYTNGKVSAGTSRDLDKYRPLYDFKPAEGRTAAMIVGIAIAPSGDLTYTWYSNQTLSIGRSWDLGMFRKDIPYKLPDGKRVDMIVDMAIAPDGRVYTWYNNGSISIGKSDDLGLYNQAYQYVPAEGEEMSTIVGLGIVAIDAEDTPAKSKILWGIDSTESITQDFINHIRRTYGDPDFFGRYLGGKYGMTDQEVKIAHRNNIKILVIDQNFGNQDTSDLIGKANGHAAADTSSKNAQDLHIPKGVAIFANIERDTNVDSDWLIGWFEGLNAKGYKAGYYANTRYGDFPKAYCNAVNNNPDIGRKIGSESYIWSSYPSLGRTDRTDRPSFDPGTLDCAAHVWAWQYGIPSEDDDGGPNVDTDLVRSDVPLWGPANEDPNPEGSRAKLAAEIRDDNRIELLDSHTSSVDDTATARKNIVDTAADKKAERSDYGNAPGGSVYLRTNMLRGMLELAKTYSYRVTEIAGGSHSSDSRHYLGVAFDVDQINGQEVSASNPDYHAFMQHCRDLGATEVLGPGDEGHAAHVHCAWPRP